MTETTNKISWTEFVAKPAQKTFEQVKDVFGPGHTVGHRAVTFGRVIGTGVGLTVAAGALRGKDAEGNDRSALARVGNVVLGGGIVAASVLTHSR